MSLNAVRLNEFLRLFSVEERTTALAVSLIENRRGPWSPLTSMTGCITTMAKHLRADERTALAELLRDVADHVEHRQRDEVMPVD